MERAVVPNPAKAEAFRQFVLERKTFVLQTHDYPDPDAIAAAYGLSRLIGTLGGTAVICHRGAITRAITQEMISVLGIPILPAVLAPGADNAIIVVDGRIRNDNVTKFPGTYVGEIDHHPGQDCHTAHTFHDIRPHYGSTSSIVGEYYRDLDISLPRSVATALSIGLNTDTQRLLRGATVEDIEIYAWLFRRADRKYLQYVLGNNIERADLAWFSRAIANLDLRGLFGLTDLAVMDNPALLAILCDFMLTVKEIGVMLAMAESSGRISLSIRSEDPDQPADALIQHLVAGLGSGGGHRSMAAGSCQIGPGQTADWIKHLLVERYFAHADLHRPRADSPEIIGDRD